MKLSETDKERFFDAIYHDDCEFVAEMLSHGASPDLVNRANESALEYAASYGRDACVEALLAHGVTYDKLPLVAAAAPPNTAVLKRFLDLGADPNEPNEYGHTPLMEAVGGDNVDAVKLLLQHGADRRKPSENGVTAVDVARDHGNQEIVALLVMA